MPSNTKPAGLQTGYSHPACYARALRDCSRKLSREHFVSRKLLSRLGKSFVINGVSWHDGPRHITPDAVAAKVLCERHNSALSPLDDMITDLYDALMLWHGNAAVGERTLEGEDLERWAIKAMIGFLVSGSAMDHVGNRVQAKRPPDSYVRILFGEMSLPRGCGLYLTENAPPGHVPRAIELTSIKVAAGRSGAGSTFGVAVSIADLNFLVTITRPMEPTVLYRPGELQLDGSGTLFIRWPTSHQGGVLRVTKKGEHNESSNLRARLP